MSFKRPTANSLNELKLIWKGLVNYTLGYVYSDLDLNGLKRTPIYQLDLKNEPILHFLGSDPSCAVLFGDHSPENKIFDHPCGPSKSPGQRSYSTGNCPCQFVRVFFLSMLSDLVGIWFLIMWCFISLLLVAFVPHFLLVPCSALFSFNWSVILNFKKYVNCFQLKR